MLLATAVRRIGALSSFGAVSTGTLHDPVRWRIFLHRQAPLCQLNSESMAAVDFGWTARRWM